MKVQQCVCLLEAHCASPCFIHLLQNGFYINSDIMIAFHQCKSTQSFVSHCNLRFVFIHCKQLKERLLAASLCCRNVNANSANVSRVGVRAAALCTVC